MTRLILVVLFSLCLLLIETVNITKPAEADFAQCMPSTFDGRMATNCTHCTICRQTTVKNYKEETSLKCRTGIQQTDDQYRKIMQTCKKRFTTNDDDDDDYSNDSSSENDDNDSSSVDLFGTRFFMSGGSKFSNTHSWKDPNENRNRGNDQRNSNDRRYSVSHTNGNWRNAHPFQGSNNRDFSYSDGAGRPSYDQMYNGNSDNYDKQQEQACINQCFFNELNMVDQRGFPDQVSIIQFLTRNIHNPELQDFIEEAVIECFHYLDSDIRQNKCYFSENLVTCLIDKGKERCEDWDN